MLNNHISQYEKATFEINQQKKLIDLYKIQIKTTRQSLNLLYQAYSNSGEEFEEVLRLQQKILEYEKREASALAKLNTAVAQINYLTAKTFENED